MSAPLANIANADGSGTAGPGGVTPPSTMSSQT
jgi:hypothetical protein